MHQTQDVLDRILEFVGVFLGLDKVGPDDDLSERGVLDSIGTTEMIYFLEAAYECEFPMNLFNPESLKSARTLATTVAEFLNRVPR